MGDSLFSQKGGIEDVKKVFDDRHSYGHTMVAKEKLKQELRRTIKRMTSKKKTD